MNSLHEHNKPFDYDKLDDFTFEYLSGKSFSWAVTVNRVKHLMKELTDLRLTKCRQCPLYSTFKSYQVVKCGKIWVAIGTQNEDSKHEIAMALDKNELEIWCDLHVKPELMS